VAQRHFGVLGQQALADQVATEIGEADSEAGFRVYGPDLGAEQRSGGGVSRVRLIVGAGDHHGAVVGEVGKGLPDRDGGQAGEQFGVARWQPVVVLV